MYPAAATKQGNPIHLIGGWMALLLLAGGCAGASLPPAASTTAEPSPAATSALRTLDAIRLTVDPADLPGICLQPSITFNIQPLRGYLGRLVAYTFDDDDVLVIMIDENNRTLPIEQAMRPLNITRAAELGIRAWCEDGDRAGLQLALNHGDWLLRHAAHFDDFAVWYNHFPNLGFDTPAGWVGAIETGQAAAVLTQLHALTGDDRYREVAALAAKAFGVQVAEGGLLRPLERGVFFEEVAYPGAPAGRILNGHMLAVEYLAYYADQTGDSEAAALVEAGIEGIRGSLDQYEASTIAAYALEPLLWSSSPDHYAHNVHLHELFWLYRYTSDPFFLDWALRWQRYKRRSLPASLYYDRISEETFRFEQIDAQRHMDVPATAESLLFDLHSVVPICSFGYNFAEPYPVAYTLALSTDGESWETVATVTDQDRHHGLHLFNTVETRYIRMTLDEIVADYNPVYYTMQDGFYAERLMLGVFRVDGETYWQDPILLLTTANIITWDTQWLQDGDPATTRPLPADAVLYGDLHTPQVIESFTVEAADSETAERRVWLAGSNDLAVWTPIIAEAEAQPIQLPGSITIPPASAPYRYFRLGFAGDDAITLSEIAVNMAAE
jgi:hypothetical protein